MTIKVQDTFTDTNGTLLNNHTPDTDVVGGGWSGSTAAEINSNQLRFDTDNSTNTIDGGTSDGDIYFDWIVASAALNRNSLIYRYTDDNNHWRYNLREDNGDVRIVERNGGTNTTRDTASFTFSGGTTYVARMNLSGTSMEGFIDDVSQVTYTSSFKQTETNHGVQRNTGSLLTKIDNFVIDDLVVAGATKPALALLGVGA
ncbi:MAG: hypothetical protein GWN00_19880 [Aliifodinibius sp.]|nr:hypothetical protein [Fodinibius sp.]NIY26981.1 hypothetical protein [Fodinibius sp.]